MIASHDEQAHKSFTRFFTVHTSQSRQLLLAASGPRAATFGFVSGFVLLCQWLLEIFSFALLCSHMARRNSAIVLLTNPEQQT